MTVTIPILLLVLAFACFVLAVLGWLWPDRIRLVAAGLALWILAQLVGSVHVG